MKYVLAAILAFNGFISSLGFAKAFDLASLGQLQPISRPLGVLWLAAAILFAIAAVMLLVRPRWWWGPAALGLVCSTLVIVAAWGDAKFGLIANAIVMVPVVVSALATLPWSFQALYDRDARQCLESSAGDTSIVTEADLAHLPDQMQRYLRFAGVVGKPRVRNYRMLFDGGLRSAPDKPFMTGLIEQQSLVSPPARPFLAHMSMFGVPAEAYHRYVGPSATFNVKVASLAHIVNESGPELTRAETVALFNDMLLLAPATVVDADIAHCEPLRAAGSCECADGLAPQVDRTQRRLRVHRREEDLPLAVAVAVEVRGGKLVNQGTGIKPQKGRFALVPHGDDPVDVAADDFRPTIAVEINGRIMNQHTLLFWHQSCLAVFLQVIIRLPGLHAFEASGEKQIAIFGVRQVQVAASSGESQNG
jgi:hypothetical protein